MFETEDTLIAQARAGNKAAFSKLVEKYYQMVYGVSYGVLNSHEDARDAAQEIFLKVFHQIIKFEGKSKFKTWLYRISVNASIDMARKRKPVDSLNEVREGEEEGENEPLVRVQDKGPSPRDRLAKDELREVFRQALDQLTPDHRVVLVLREWEELSYEEIAEMLQIDMGTVMSRLFYGRKKLAEILKVRLKDGSLR